MIELFKKKCEACRVGAPKVTPEETERLMKQVPDWQLIDDGGVRQLQRDFTFKNFREALAFTNQVGEIAEEQGHHPDIQLGWGNVRVTWWSHKIKGLHENDFIMAAKTDSLL